jgi:hypothetical protein
MTMHRNLVRTPAALALAAGLGLLAFLGAQKRGQAQPKAPLARIAMPAGGPMTELRIVERVGAASDRALDYLERIQVKEGPNTGAWTPGNNAMNAMAVLAFLSRGHVPGRGKYGDTIEGGVVRPGVLTRAKKFILSKAAATGYLSVGGTMYEHGLATLALAEMYGMDPDPELEEKLRKAVDLIMRAQGPVGGWNYGPSAADGDLSVSVMQIVALRAANNAEIPVPEKVIQKATAYVKAKGNPSGGGFGYNGPNAGTVQTSAAGTLSLQLLGKPDDPQVIRTLDYLAPTRVAWQGGGANYFYYFHYYAIQAFYQGGGKHWNEWHPQVREMLLEKQNKDGSWDVPPGTAEVAYAPADNKTYSTALATLILNIYMHYLPAYQR